MLWWHLLVGTASPRLVVRGYATTCMQLAPQVWLLAACKRPAHRYWSRQELSLAMASKSTTVYYQVRTQQKLTFFA